MKINQEDQNKLEELFAENCKDFVGISNLHQFVEVFKAGVANESIKVKKCEATNCFSRLLRGEALSFVCDEIYKYANDDHLAAFYRKLYKKYS